MAETNGAGALTVLVGVTSRSWGGNEKWASEAATGLKRRGHRVSVFWSHDEIERELARRGLEGRRIRLWGDVNPAGLFSLLRLMRDVRPDVVILTKQREYWMGGLLAPLARRPLVVLRQGLNRPLANDLKRRLAFGTFADAVIVNSNLAKETLLASPWLDPEKVVVLMNGVRSEPPVIERGESFIRSAGVPTGAPIVAAAGRLTSQKGFDILIEAFATVADARPSAVLLILGEGGQRATLEREVRSRGLAERVLIPGHTDHVRDVLAVSDVYALSSRNEGMANTLLEAMSVGAPIAATDVSGTREAIRPGVDGLVVPPDDPAALASAILKLLEDRSLASRLGASARSRAIEQFPRERMITELESLIRDRLAGRAGG